MSGTISSLMNQELESASSTSYTPSSSSRLTSAAVPFSVSCGDGSLNLNKSMDEASSGNAASTSIKPRSLETIRRGRGQSQHRIPVLGPTTPKRQKQKTSPPEEGINKRSPPEFSRKITRCHKRSHHIPILGSEDIGLNKTPNREKHRKKGINIVEVVGTSCGSPPGSLTNRLRKLGFSKLS